jgi:hypothetical protein
MIDVVLLELFSRLAHAGSSPAGLPFVRFPSGMDGLETELGVPVATGVCDAALTETSLPAGRAAPKRHVGDWDGLLKARRELHSWLHALGEEPLRWHWEVYLRTPSQTP